jgi:hypothetical protein
MERRSEDIARIAGLWIILTTSVSLTKISGRNRAILTIALLHGYASSSSCWRFHI